jgi:ketosteroid isomerase-like protein
MSQENVEIARLGYELFNRGDIDAFLDLAAPDIEWRDHGAFDTSAIQGRDAVRAFLETVLEPWEEFKKEPEEIIDLGGDEVLGLFHATGRGRQSGIEVDVRGGDLLTIRKCSVVRFAAYPRAQALQAAGLSE